MRVPRQSIVAVIAAALLSVFLFPTAAAAAPADKTAICHYNADGDLDAPTWKRLMIKNNKALDKHEAHGDVYPGDAVPGMVGHWFDSGCSIFNNAPTVDDQTLSVDENSTNATVVGTIVFGDPDSGFGDIATLTVTGGTGTASFAVDEAGTVTVADSANLDFETMPSFTLEVQVSDIAGLTDAAVITINLNDLNECTTITTESELRAAAAAGGDYCIDATSTIMLTTGEVSVATTMFLTGIGPGNATIDANDTGRVLNVTSTGDLTLNNVMITGGNIYYDNGGGIRNDGSLTLNGSTLVTDNTATAGGGIWNYQGSVTLNDSASVTDNTANNGGGIHNNASVTLSGSSSVTNNTAYSGGGINNHGFTHSPASLTLNDSASVTDNTATTDGGGILNLYGSVTLNGSSSVTDNTANNGGGILNGSSGSVTLNDSASVTDNIPDNCVPSC